MDLLKIDVERAELSILRGVSMSDWPKIKQIVLEVHDLNNRLADVEELLAHQAGFQLTAVEQDPTLKGTTLYNIYAHRQ